MAIEVPDWSRVVWLTGKDPSGDPIIIGTDANGYIIAVMKGEYAGTLTTVAVDAAGRILMIPTDPADVWDNAISTGIGELIAALTPAKRFDRRGDIIFIEGFESGLTHGVVTTSGTGAAVAVTTAEARSGGLAAKLTGGSDGSRYAALSWYFHQTPEGKIGLEAHFRPDADIQYLVLQIAWYDGAELHQGNLRWNNDNEDFEYYDSAGAYQQLQTGDDLIGRAGLFHTAKLVVDVENDLYHRALCRAAEVDMSSYALYTPTDTSGPYILFTVFLYSHSGDNDWCYLDNVIMTQNEPA